MPGTILCSRHCCFRFSAVEENNRAFELKSALGWPCRGVQVMPCHPLPSPGANHPPPLSDPKHCQAMDTETGQAVTDNTSGGSDMQLGTCTSCLFCV